MPNNKNNIMPDINDAKLTLNTDYMNYFELNEYNHRRLYINYEIDETIIDSIAYHILRYNRMDQGLMKEEREPIIIYINSPGGDVIAGFALIDAILASETPVYTVNQGMCFSMGFLIFLAGEKRYAMKHSEFLMHDGTSSAWDSTAKMKDRMDFEINQIEKSTKDYIMSRTNIDDDLYERKYRVEWYMMAEEAKTHNIVTNIVGTDCDLNEIL